MAQKGKISFMQALLIAVGFVIGSGIFFRADNILVATQGNVLIAILGWIFLGSTLIFAGISVSVLAEKSQGSGGIAAYIEDVYGAKAGYLVGFFMSTLYAPLMIGVLGTVMMRYMTQLFGWSNLTAGHGFYIAVVVLLFFVYLWNFLSTKIAAGVSSVATMVKVIPLIVIGIAGIIFGDGSNIFEAGMHANASVPDVDQNASFIALFVAPFVSMGFAFDGWISVAALSNDIENPNKNLPKVLFIGTTIITLIYVTYFIGVTMLMDPAEIIKQGDAHVGIIANQIFGDMGGKLILVGVIISVLGTLNSNVMAGMRYPSSMARDNTFMFKDKIGKISPKTGTPLFGGLYSVIVAAFGLMLYGFQETFGIFSGIAFDDIPVFMLSVFYIALFIGVYKVGRKENLSKMKTIVAPIIATIGQGLIVIAFYVTNDKAVLYTIVIAIVMLIGYFLRNFKNN